MPRPVVVQTPFRGVGDRSVAAQRDVVFPDMVVVEGPPRDTVVYLLAAAFGIEEFYKLKYCSTVVYMVPRA